VTPGCNQADRRRRHDDGGRPDCTVESPAINAAPHDLRIVGNHDDEKQERRGQQALYHSRPEQGLDRIEADKVYQRS
jgi:hypothetical protein